MRFVWRTYFNPSFLRHIDRIFAEGYVPTEEDVLRARVKTSGVYEMRFQISETTWVLVDVGGQRAERRKWIHCFDVMFDLSLTSIEPPVYSCRA